MRPHDIPEYVQDGVVDAGITGANLIARAGADVVDADRARLRRCALEAAVRTTRRSSALADLDGLRVATTYPVSTPTRLPSTASTAELVLLSGSVEAAPRLGLADAIVDLVSTGSTMTANGLRRIGRLLDSQAVFIGNRAHDRARSASSRAARADAARRRRRHAAAAT